MSNDNSRVYELGLQIVPSVAEENVPTIFSGIKDAIEKAGGAFISEEYPKLRPLAYTMVKSHAGQNTKFSMAYFGWVKFEMESGEIASIKEKVEKDLKILRYILIKTVREDTLQSHKLTQRRERVEKKAESSEPISEAELDKTIEGLVVE